MIEEALLHPTTRHNLHRIIANPPHAIALSGVMGSGKAYIAKLLAAAILDTSPDRLALHPYFYVLRAIDNKSISIEQIRELQKTLTLRTTGNTSKIRRVLCILDADSMTTEAQNAMLKTLEEPPADTVIVLTTHQYEDLLPTIRSRTQEVPILPVDASSAQQYFATTNTPLSAIIQAHAISGGAVGLLLAIIDDTHDHPMLQDITYAKELLSFTVYERLCRIEELSKQKDTPARILESLLRICLGALRASLHSKQTESARAWLQRVRHVTQAQEALAKNANPKIVLCDLFMSL